ncbi:MAG: hypothetical protein LBU85_11115, partial [Treponema sp.]|nr:hypothetical protein [Treponema sp.]
RFVSEQEAKIDQDEIDVTFDTSYSTDELSAYKGEPEYEIGAKIICDTLKIKPCKPAILIIGASGGHE